MYVSLSSPLCAVVAAAVVLGVFAPPGLAQSGTEARQAQEAITEEEAVKPDDGSQDSGVVEGHPSGTTPADMVPGGEAAKVLEDAQKDDTVTASDMKACMDDWDPGSEMTKAEWEQSCRSTLKYFPDKHE